MDENVSCGYSRESSALTTPSFLGSDGMNSSLTSSRACSSRSISGTPRRFTQSSVVSLQGKSFYADPQERRLLVPARLRRGGARVYVQASSESDSDVAFEVQVLYSLVPGAIECDGPVYV